MAFATTAQLCQQFDRRDLAGLCAESNTVVVRPETVESNPIAVAALERASGVILSSALIAGKYSADDLDDLANNSDGFLIWLTCAVAVGQMLQRRAIQQGKLQGVAEQAEEWLKRLRDGEAIFNIASAEQAGLVHLTTPTVQQLSDAGMATAPALGRYLPYRVVQGGG